MNGIVIKSTGKKYTVRTASNDIIQCSLKGNFRIKEIKSTNPIVVGDKVRLEKLHDNFMIVELYKRKNTIIRKSVNLSKRTHIIASNIDQAFLMITLENPLTKTGFIDRFLVSANAYGVDVILLFNKMDLLNKEQKLEQENLQKVYEHIGYNCFALSVIKDDLSMIKNIMKDKINMISGYSGSGKSTMINKIQPNLNIKTRDISIIHKQGQHTTTFSELYELDFGASIIDTPGIKGFGLVDLDLKKLCDYFPEFFILRSDCKYYNCIHKDEPNCAVKLALDNGKISSNRYKNYLDMLLEEDTNFRTTNY